ncbi:MAG TPA: hypothetical protein VF710_20720 [Longimicrobium sp.]|jgi:hypothetical protein
MVSMGLQLLVTALLLSFGVLSLVIAGRAAFQKPFHQVFWKLAGGAFVTHGTLQATQNLWGSLAMAAGMSSATMATYLRWVPAFNHSRTFLWLAFSGVAVWLARRGTLPGPRAWGGIVVALACGLVVGALLGYHEGSILASTHYTRVALLDALELVILLVVLFVALVSGRVDRHLWGALAVFATMVALNIVWYAAMSMIDDKRVWTPAPWMMSAYRVVPTSVMVAIAVRRLQLAKRGVKVPSLLDRGSSGAPLLAG